MKKENVIVIGGGPAGYTASLYAARAGLEPLCIEGWGAGGQLLVTGQVENFPGFPDGGLLGPDLVDRIRRQAESFGARFVTRDVTAVDLSEPPFRVDVGDEAQFAKAVIIATGATARQLGLESEAALQNRGVAYCATCDGPLFTGKRVAIVGGGDAALEEAIGMSKYASEVLVVHRRDELRASKIMQQYARSNDKIVFATPYVVDEILDVAAGRVTGLRLQHVDTGEKRVEDVEGVFVSIGHDPNTALFREWIDCDPHGYITVTPGTSRTSVEGIFAAGDVQDPHYRQAVTSAGSGCMAALDAERWLAHRVHGADPAEIRWAVDPAAAVVAR
jgi:thioredoxin reductase (NADPH)